MAECKNIMVYVETAEGNPVKVGLEMLSPAKKLADKVTAVVIGGGVADAAKEVARPEPIRSSVSTAKITKSLISMHMLRF